MDSTLFIVRLSKPDEALTSPRTLPKFEALLLKLLDNQVLVDRASNFLVSHNS